MPITTGLQKELLNSFLTALTKLNLLLIKSTAFKPQMELYNRYLLLIPRMGERANKKETSNPNKAPFTSALALKAVD